MITDTDMLLATAIIMFILGSYGMITKRDGLKIILAIEILVVACNMVFIVAGFATSSGLQDAQAESYVLLSLSIGGAVIGLALAVLSRVYRIMGTDDLNQINSLRW